MPISEETKGNFSISVGNERVAGDVVGDCSCVPSLDSLLMEEVALEFPEEGLGKGLVLF